MMSDRFGLFGADLIGETRMPTIAWDPSMSTGLESIDTQHRQLIAWLNDLLAAVSEGRGRSEVEVVLDQLERYAATHFSHEEDCMARYNCPVAAQNIAAHKDFVKTFTGLREEFDRDGATAHVIVRVETELMRWLTSHIKRTDTGLAACIPRKVA
jgi:hemerythrin-like metal-binding protein